MVAVVALIGVAMDLALAATTADAFPAGTHNVLNTLTYFTVMSNIIVAVTSALLATRWPNTTKFNALLLDGLICIIVTAVVYHTMIGPTANPTGWDAISNFFTHTLVPALAVVGWLVFGPRRRFNKLTVELSLVIPIGWLIFTTIRGAVTHYYPYDFVNVNELGYTQVAITCMVIIAMFVALALATIPIDRALTSATEPG